MRVALWSLLGGTSFSAFLFLVYVGSGRIAPGPNGPDILPDPAHASRVQAQRAQQPAVGVPLEIAPPPNRVGAKRRAQTKLDRDDPYTGEDLAAKMEIAANAPLQFDRHDPFDPTFIYPVIELQTLPFDDSDPFSGVSSATSSSQRTASAPARRSRRHASTSLTHKTF